MKIRTDFVTNSSSSSFIVAYKEHDSSKSDATQRDILFNILLRCIDQNGYTSGDTQVKERAYDSCEIQNMCQAYLTNEYSSRWVTFDTWYREASKENKAILKKCLRFCEKDYVIAIFQIAYGDVDAKHAFELLQKKYKSDFKILDGEREV